MSDNADLILVGFDGSGPSKQALRWAVELSRLTGAQLEAISVWNDPAYFGYPFPYEGWEVEADPQGEFDAALDELFPAARPPRLTLSVQKGDPARILIDQSHRATMLVVGNRGRGGFASLLMGSVSSKCVHHSACPILVVRGTQEIHVEQHQAPTG